MLVDGKFLIEEIRSRPSRVACSSSASAFFFDSAVELDNEDGEYEEGEIAHTRDSLLRLLQGHCVYRCVEHTDSQRFDPLHHLILRS